MPHVVAAPDKFRGTASAAQVAAAIGRAAAATGWSCDQAPVADGGEGTLEAVGGHVRRARVRGPLGEAVEAEWRLLPAPPGGAGAGPTAVIEMARAAGLELTGGAEWNDPMRASTEGVGDLILVAAATHPSRIVVAVGGSASTDGGLGCLSALQPRSRLAGVELIVACDVTTTFVDAAEAFAPQKGASPAQVALLRRRLERLAQVYRDDYGVDVASIPGSGAAGGLAGALAAIGARLVAGFDFVADTIELAERIEGADLVVAGEGFLDEHSFAGKAVGGVVELAAEAAVPVLVVVGEAFADSPVPTVSLVDRFGRERSFAETVECIEAAVAEHLRGLA